jgi:hypothetical protein
VFAGRRLFMMWRVSLLIATLSVVRRGCSCW